MKVIFYRSDKARERLIANNFRLGVLAHGDEFEVRNTNDYGDGLKYEGPTDDTDCAMTLGLKGKSKDILDDHLTAGMHVLFMDKGYIRRRDPKTGFDEFHRISFDAFQPVDQLMSLDLSSARWDSLDLKLHDRPDGRGRGEDILFAGGSQKYCTWHKLRDATEYAQAIVKHILKNPGTDRRIIYRPKPSWRDAVPIDRTIWSGPGEKIEAVLRRCFCIVTFGSNVGVDAILAGVPVVALGDTIARPVSETDLDNVGQPQWFDERTRKKWATNMAWFQWTVDEMASGEAWAFYKGLM